MDFKKPEPKPPKEGQDERVEDLGKKYDKIIEKGKKK